MTDAWNKCDYCGKYISIKYLNDAPTHTIPPCPHCKKPFMYTYEGNDSPQEIRELKAHAEGW